MDELRIDAHGSEESSLKSEQLKKITFPPNVGDKTIAESDRHFEL